MRRTIDPTEERLGLQEEIQEAQYAIKRLDKQIDLKGPLVDLVVRKRIEEYRLDQLWQSWGSYMQFYKAEIDFSNDTVCVDFEPADHSGRELCSPTMTEDEKKAMAGLLARLVHREAEEVLA